MVSIIIGTTRNGNMVVFQYQQPYRRDFIPEETIERLMEATKGKMFNSWRFGKFYLYKHIKKRKTLVEYLPETEVTVDYRQVKTFIDRVGHVILKPIYLSRGRGI